MRGEALGLCIKLSLPPPSQFYHLRFYGVYSLDFQVRRESHLLDMTPPEDPPGPDITASLKSSPLHPSRFAHELLLLVLEADPDLCLVNNAKHGDGTDCGSEDVLMNHTLLSLSHTCRVRN